MTGGDYQTINRKLNHQLGKSKMMRQSPTCRMKEGQETVIRTLQEVKVGLPFKSDS